MDTKTAITLLITVFLAMLGYTITYVNNLKLAQRKERLERVNRQLEKLYGCGPQILDPGPVHGRTSRGVDRLNATVCSVPE